MKYPSFPRALIATLACALALPLSAAWAQQRGEGPLDSAQPNGLTPEQIIERFAAKEKQFQQAREQYTYTQSIKVQTLDGNTVSGEFQMVEDVVFDDKGRRIQQVRFAPQSTLENGGISISKEDLDDIEHRLPFVLTSDEISEYNILYIGRQSEDELQTYVFDIAPKTIEKNHRYFQGRIWVDSQDFQIVKTEGKTVPDIRQKNNENLFPKFTTWREQIDGQYWFPTFTRADDILHFRTGLTGDVHIREIVKYTNYKRFGANVKITYQGEELPKAEPQPGQQPAQKPPK
jgi:outer membrane lipoprotein-sorting protein